MTHNGRAAAFQAARDWARQEARPDDEVMIITAGFGLRIVRSLRPAAEGLLQDLDRVSGSPGASDFWAAGEEDRIIESKTIPSPEWSTPTWTMKRHVGRWRTFGTPWFSSIRFGVKSLLLFEETIGRSRPASTCRAAGPAMS